MALGGEPGHRLARKLAIEASGDTLLRHLRRFAASAGPAASPRVLGVDDWAWKKGHTYGTLLVDLEKHRAVDLLPVRSSDAFAEWLEAHPGAKVITRDRSNLYAEGATRGAPGAIQVADRWHLLHNLTEAVERILERRAAALQHVSAAPTLVPVPEGSSAAPEPVPVPSEPPLVAGPSMLPQAQQARRELRLARYEEMMKRHAQGWTQKAIADAVGLSVRTLQRWLAAGGFPERKERARSRSKLDPYRAYLQTRVAAGHTNAAQLWREVRAQGFDGQRGIVGLYVRELRSGRPPRVGRSKRRPSLRRTAWLLTRADEQIGPQERQYIDALKAKVPELAEVQRLAVEFGRLLREHDIDAFHVWFSSAEEGLLGSFAAGLQWDERAVRAAVTEPWSNGQVEGQVTRLKLVKRQMYGRAGFDLLRARVLEAA